MLENNYFTDDEDLKIIFDYLMNWDEIAQAAATHHAPESETPPANTETEGEEYYRMVLESMGELCGRELAANAAAMDRQGVRFREGRVEFPEEQLRVFELFRAAGLLPVSIPIEYGGLGLPATMMAMCGMLLSRADAGFGMAVGLLNLAQIITRFGTEEQKEKYVRPMAAGDCMGAMALTEPDYGSDLANIGTRAERKPDGTYVLNGTKRFISQACGLGDKPCVILTMARTGKPGSGARGLSLFLVHSDDVVIAGIENKMGIHASPTCEVVYEDTPGELLGSEGLGLTRYTLGMTNFMRLGSASMGAGAGAAAVFQAQEYAATRRQFGKSLNEIPAVADMLDYLHRETAAMRLLTLEAGRAVDLYLHERIHLEGQGLPDREIRKTERARTWSGPASVLTPLAKYYCSETGLACASIALQIHGGSGYTEDYDIARIYRDARINTIYEGTSQIQAASAGAGITAGMGKNGHLRAYLEKELNGFAPSPELMSLWAVQEECLYVYREIEEGDSRERMTETLVTGMARFICSLLLERALFRLGELNSPRRERWARYSKQYNIDSGASLRANLFRLQAV